MKLHPILGFSALVALCTPTFSVARPPAMTPEEQAIGKEKVDAEKEKAAEEKRKVERAQDRVVKQYRRDNPEGAQNANKPDVDPKQLPKPSVVPPGEAGPHGRPGDASAEAHSAPSDVEIPAK